MNFRKYAVAWMILIFLGNTKSPIMAQVDTMAYFLDTVTVTAKRNTSSLKGNINGTLRWDMDMLHYLPRILGNTDPVHYAQLLPGVQSRSEYDSGFYIQGLDNGHNLISIENIPIYNPSHLLGFFSVFNASHFPQMHFSKISQNSSTSNHLGGILNMQLPDSLQKKTNGEYAIGPISSQGTLRMPINRKSSLFISMRTAYINFLYNKWLNISGNQLKYDFSDYNLTYLYIPNYRNQIKADLYIGYDNASFNEKSYYAINRLKWKNEKLSLTWRHRWQKGLDLKQTLYYTSYNNHYHLRQEDLNFNLPSYIKDFAYKGIFNYHQCQLGTDIIFHKIQPQNPNIDGSYHTQVNPQPKQLAFETALYTDYYKEFLFNWSIKTGFRFTYYCGEKMRRSFIDPMLTLSYSSHNLGNLNLNIRQQHQYLFQTGFSNIGLPTEFWFAAGKKHEPQSSRSISLAYDISLFNGAYKLCVEGYYKKLYGQVEYKGTIFDFLNTIYSLDKVLLKGNGNNYGINIMLNKQSGNLTGWVSYSWGRSLRKFKDNNHQKSFPSRHERIHELNATATYQINSKCIVGGTVILASGTPYTCPEYIYWIANHVVAKYGEYNASRLNPYFRLDLSINYNFIKKRNKELGINFSLYNVTSHTNELYHRFSFNEKNKTYSYKPVHFVLKMLPSFNLYHKF